MSPPKIVEGKTGQADAESFETRLEKRLMGSTRLNGIIPKKRSDVIKWNGWGYNDSKFVLKPGPMIAFTGNRYPIGELDLPDFTQWVIDTFALDFMGSNPHRNPWNPMPPPEAYPKPNVPQEFLDEIDKCEIGRSLEGDDRLMRCHGQTLHDIYTLRFDLNKSIPRIPDVVLWPGLVNGRDQEYAVAEEK